MPNATKRSSTPPSTAWSGTCWRQSPQFGPSMSIAQPPTRSQPAKLPKNSHDRAQRAGHKRGSPDLALFKTKGGTRMASKNVETLRAAHESWNKRDFPGVVKNAAEGLVYTDNARAVTLNSRDKFREWTEGWAKAFSDGRITNPEYIDAGDIVIARFIAV